MNAVLKAVENAPVVTLRQPEPWNEPEPLPTAIAPVEPFDPALLPETLRPYVVDIAERMQCPMDFVAVGLMVVLSAVIGRQIGIYPKEHDNWLVIPNLWGMVVGRPSVLKSPALEAPLKLLYDLESAAKREYDDELVKFNAQKEIAEEQVKELRNQIKKAVQTKKSPEPYAQQIAELNSRPEPSRKRHICNDATVEKVGELLKQNPNGLLLFRDELSGFLKQLEKPGHEASKSFYMEAWKGNAPFTYDRIQRGTVDIPAACISVLGTIQPGPLQSYIPDTNNSGDDGLIQRFQLMVYPDVVNEWKNVDRKPDNEAHNKAIEVVKRLSALKPYELGAEEGTVPGVRFNPEAREIFTEWFINLKARLKHEAPLMEAHLAKYPSLVPSLALIIHLSNNGAMRVGKEPLLQALAWAEYLESHSRRIYGTSTPDLESARLLLAQLQKTAVPNPCTARYIYRRGWSGLNDKESAEQALNGLIEYGYARLVEKPKTPGRHSDQYEFHPSVRA